MRQGPVPIIACSRSTGRVARALRELGCETVPLPLEADWRPLPDRYLLGEERVAERLTTSQFVRAITTKTLFLSALDLRATVATPVFVIEGEGFGEYSRLHPNAVRGALSALIVEYGASVLRSTEEADSAGLLALMARHAQFGVPEISVAAKRRADSPADEQRRVVEMLPGIGFSLARRLLQYFGTIRRLLQATPEELAQVPGVSPTMGHRVCELACREYCAVDFESEIEDVLVAQPGLLFEAPVELVARQHVFREGDGRRLVADLIFADRRRKLVTVVEVKRGALRQEDVRQLAAYLDAAGQSPLLRSHLDQDYSLRGVLAAPAAQIKRPGDRRITLRVIDTDAIAAELLRRRLARLEAT